MVTLNNQRVYDMLISPTMGIETKKQEPRLKKHKMMSCWKNYSFQLNKGIIPHFFADGRYKSYPHHHSKQSNHHPQDPCMLYMVTWILSIYPFMLAYIPAPWILWVTRRCRSRGSLGFFKNRFHRGHRVGQMLSMSPEIVALKSY
jgi:hypothetical protein